MVSQTGESIRSHINNWIHYVEDIADEVIDLTCKLPPFKNKKLSEKDRTIARIVVMWFAVAILIQATLLNPLVSLGIALTLSGISIIMISAPLVKNIISHVKDCKSLDNKTTRLYGIPLWL